MKMDVFAVLSMLGGIAMLLYGMDAMGKGLERLAGGKMQSILKKLTSTPVNGFFLGLLVTAVIQSSGATTVMVVGFVNSSIMSLHQASGVVMGANVGTTVTAWILSLTGLEGETFWIKLLKPSSFSPLIAAVGIVLYMFGKKDKTKNTGHILLGFAILMFGMETVSDAMAPLKDMPGFVRLFTLFSNPILGMIAGMLLTALVQSSSASVGILQALSATGVVSWSSAIPIILGQNIGACVTPLLSAIGAKSEARRAAMIHLLFNVIGAILFLILWMVADCIVDFAFKTEPISMVQVAIVHTGFNLIMTIIFLPCSRLLEKLSALIIKDDKKQADIVALDDRLLNTPAVAVEQCREAGIDMALQARDAILEALEMQIKFDAKGAEKVRTREDILDRFEDKLGTYLVKLSAHEMLSEERRETGILLHVINDFERMGDHALNLVESAEELHDKKMRFSDSANKELKVLTAAIKEIVTVTFGAFVVGDLSRAHRVEPLEQVIDDLTKELRARHVDRLQSGECTIHHGFVLSDLITNYERIADHCSNVAAALIEAHAGDFDLHGYTAQIASGEEYIGYYEAFRRRFVLP